MATATTTSKRPLQRPSDPGFHEGANTTTNNSNNESGSGSKRRSSSKSLQSGGFQSLGLSEPVYRGVVKMGFNVPTPVQRRALPICLSGADVVCMARTGSGKTAAFVLPILEKLLVKESGGTLVASSSVRAVILSPTRELALQTLKVFHTLSHYCSDDAKAVGIIGADSMDRQFAMLASRPHVLVATPGRLAHHLSEIPDFHLSRCETLVLDEADRLFEMGFTHQIREICRTLPSNCQKLLFSATMPKALVEFTKGSTGVGLVDPQVVRLDSEVKVSDELRLAFVTSRTDEKDAVLLYILRDLLRVHEVEVETEENKEETNTDKKNNAKGKNKNNAKGKQQQHQKHKNLTLLFCATRHHVEYVTALLLAADIPATMIYGTMDLQARRENLQKFRSGRTPVLVVTDVAARGIDVPLLQNVVHHSFPPTAKLFVHRSGRAARAGRIGHCFGLVDPDEVPYMVDLHVFLGRRLTTSDQSYSVAEMTPDMVHYGSVPEYILSTQVEELHRLVDNGGSKTGGVYNNMANMRRVCDNAMKQYRRSRPDASRAAIRKGKETVLNHTKKVPPHPILLRVQEEYLKDSCSDSRRDDLKKRQEFLEAMANFRPKETVFEAFATGTGGGPEHGQVDKKARDTTAYSSNALKVMKGMRRQMRLARNKGASMVVAGSENAKVVNGEEVEGVVANDNHDSKEDVNETSASHDNMTIDQDTNMDDAGTIKVITIEPKKRMSKAQRRQLRKTTNPNNISGPATTSASADNKNSNSTVVDYKDHDHYIDTSQSYDERQANMESAMQPSAASSSKSGGGMKAQAHRMEEAMLDIVGDENSDLVRKQRMMRWDKSKRKYIQTSVGEELNGNNKKVRTESGKMLKVDRAKLGELYEKWQKKTQKSIGRSGVFDEDAAAATDDADTATNIGANVEYNGRKRERNKGISNKKHGNTTSDPIHQMQQRAAEQNSKGGGSNNNKKNADSMKSVTEIRKDRESKQKLKVKNMKKSDRKAYETNNKSSSTKDFELAKQKKGYQGKKGVSGNWGKRKR